jgi:DNA invertase Pin-like site-specific DNA recombinase
MNTPEQILSQKFGKFRKNVMKKVETKLAVKMTRVSHEKQIANDSIEIQNKFINEYADKHGYQIVANFGDTHESAKTDDRKEFKRMIEFCKKSKGKISTILVYKMTRFSRTGGSAISIADELRTKYGIHIIAVTEPTDTTNANGVLFQEMQLIFAKWDNVQRQQVTSEGMISKYEKGIWLSNPPQGYDIVKSNGERKIIINEEGKNSKKHGNGNCKE